MTHSLLMIIAGYLIGSVSSAILVCRLMGLPDPRTSGSLNPGATNVLRIGTKLAAALTLAGDMLKGLIPVVAAHALGLEPLVVGATGLAAFLGHLYPVFFGFKGGKGVATILGVLIGFHWLLGLTVIGTWLAVAAVFRISSLAALVAAALAPAYAWWLIADQNIAIATLIMTILVFWRHRSNIRNLINGEEKKLGYKDKPAEAAVQKSANDG